MQSLLLPICKNGKLQKSIILNMSAWEILRTGCGDSNLDFTYKASVKCHPGRYKHIGAASAGIQCYIPVK